MFTVLHISFHCKVSELGGLLVMVQGGNCTHNLNTKTVCPAAVYMYVYIYIYIYIYIFFVYYDIVLLSFCA